MSTLQERIDRAGRDIDTPALAGGMVCADSINRMLDHVNNSDMFAMFTAARKDLTEEENERLNLELVRVFAAKGIGPLKLVGDSAEWGMEDSFLFPYYKERATITPTQFEKMVRQLNKKYKQDAYVIGNGKSVFLENLKPKKSTVRFKKFEVLTGLKKLKKDDLEYIWSQVKKYKHRDIAFRFSGVLVPTGFMSAVSFKQCGLSWR